MKNIKKITVFLYFGLCLGIPASLWGGTWPPQPFIIAGTVKVNGIQVTSEDGNTYTIIATNEDLMPFSPAAEDRDGLREDYGTYNISIPIYDAVKQPDGAVPGEKVILNVYRNGSKLLVTSPYAGRITVGQPSATAEVNLETLTGPTDEDCKALVDAERKKWDVDDNGQIGLPEAIRALQIVSGIPTAQ